MRLLKHYHALKQRCDARAQFTVVRNVHRWHGALYLRFESIAWLKGLRA